MSKNTRRRPLADIKAELPNEIDELCERLADTLDPDAPRIVNHQNNPLSAILREALEKYQR